MAVNACAVSWFCAAEGSDNVSESDEDDTVISYVKFI